MRGRAALAAVAATLVALGAVVADRYFWTFDSLAVLEGASAAHHCLDAGLVPCHASIWDASFFPLAQYVPAYALVALGLGGDLGLHWLSWISYACFAGSLLLSWTVVARTRGRALAAIVVLALLASELVVYADSAFGEMLATFLTLAFTAALVTEQPAWVAGLLLALACTTKEVAPPLLAALAFAALAPRWEARADRRRLVAALAVGLLAGVAVNSGFNWFRWSTLSNHVYAGQLGDLPLTWWPQFFGTSLFAPNAGFVAAWPVVAALAVVAGIAAWRMRGAGPRIRAAAPLALLLLVLAAFAAYFKPFGWFAWFDRYAVPWVPSVLLLIAVDHGQPLSAALGRLARRPALYWATAAVVAAFAVAHAGALAAGQQRSFGWLFGGDATCPKSIVVVDYRLAYPARCQLHYAWGKHLVLLRGIGSAFETSGLALTLTTIAAALALAGYSRRELLRAS